MAGPDDFVALVGDIGGTNARFAIATHGAGGLSLDRVAFLPVREYPTFETAVAAYLADHGPPRLDAAAAACAGPVVDGAVSFTNIAWATNEAALAEATGVRHALLLNDLAAVAWAAPTLAPDRLRPVAQAGMSHKASGATCAIFNAGTGTNASAFVRNSSGSAVVVGEYGHASFAPSTDLELALWRLLQARFGRLSNERVLCGPGLLNIYHGLCTIDGVPAQCQSPAEVTAAMQAGDAMASRAAECFCGALGAVAGDVALAYGAQAGVYLCGGVAVSLMHGAFDDIFRERFADKGRFRPYLELIPSFVIEDSHVALLGAARAALALAAPSAAA